MLLSTVVGRKTSRFVFFSGKIALAALFQLEMRAKERTPESEAVRKKSIDQKIADASREFQPLPSTSQVAAAPGSFNSTPLRRGVETPTGRSLRESVDSGRPAPHNLEAVLHRKHEWETAAKRASGRSWHELYFVLNAALGTLSAYKDARSAHDKPGHLYHKEVPVSLAGAVAAPATNYDKRPCVFRLKVSHGGESLFQCPSEDEMHNWVEAINAIAASLPPPVAVMPTTEEEEALEGEVVGPAGRSATLPSTALHLSEPGSSSGQAPAPSKSKKKFFTLMRKKEK